MHQDEILLYLVYFFPCFVLEFVYKDIYSFEVYSFFSGSRALRILAVEFQLEKIFGISLFLSCCGSQFYCFSSYGLNYQRGFSSLNYEFSSSLFGSLFLSFNQSNLIQASYSESQVYENSVFFLLSPSLYLFYSFFSSSYYYDYSISSFFLFLFKFSSSLLIIHTIEKQSNIIKINAKREIQAIHRLIIPQVE
eukprot:TRINITY_DN8721_c0_g1_i1.p3 TRINITY_DN8721_c0_g1~~TRINITY_DN8721_c0_g1_i1.p3  ORF type:complete len:193 (-),score=8.65 TRINITY_DN8721_c0_g1_i1:498-1076(-)